MTIDVFAGPSLFPFRPADFPGIRFRGPAAKGDLLRAAMEGASVIGLIDGFFETAPSVWHKEILYLLSRGISVYGAASMGALRAAECAEFGMIGVGGIFQDYVAGRRESDADVAVQHAPAALDYQPMTCALVDAEAAVETLHRTGMATAEEALKLIAASRRLNFKERTWKAVVAEAGIAGARADHIFEEIGPAGCQPQAGRCPRTAFGDWPG